MKDRLDDATRSRLANFLRKLGGGQLNLYAITERKPKIVILVVATCAEEALKLIRETIGLDWDTGNTTTRALQRNIDAEAEVITAFKLLHQRVRSFSAPREGSGTGGPSAPWPSGAADEKTSAHNLDSGYVSPRAREALYRQVRVILS